MDDENELLANIQLASVQVKSMATLIVKRNAQIVELRELDQQLLDENAALKHAAERRDVFPRGSLTRKAQA